MGLEDLIEEIISQAEKKAEKIIEEGKAEAVETKKKARQRAAKAKEKTIKNVEKITTELRQMELSSLNLKLKKDFLHAKKKIVDDLVSESLARIAREKGKEADKMLKCLVEKALNELPNAKFIYANKGSAAAVKKFFPKLKFEKLDSNLGGIILENGDRKVRVNYSFKEIMDKVREENLNEISKRLFG